MYDFAGAQVGSGTAWNWGLDMDEIDRRIEAVIPSYKHEDTDGFSEQLYFSRFGRPASQISARLGFST